MAKKINPKKVEAALAGVTDEASFIQNLLIDLLEWPIDPAVRSVEPITYDWSKEDFNAKGLDKKVVDGQVRQLVLDGCPWGIFIVAFKNPDVFQSGRGMTVPLRQVLSGLVPRQRKSALLPSFSRTHLLFICTHDFQAFRFVHFKDPGAAFKQPTLASFGWHPGDSTKTVSTFNLPNLLFLDPAATVDDWIAAWTKAFDVERVTKDFYDQYKNLHKAVADAARHVSHANDRPWLASVVLNRLMFVYFLQRKGFIDGGKQHYLEDKLAASKAAGKDRFYDSFLSLLFFEGFAKPLGKRSDAAKKALGDVRYLNGGLFLEHPIEQAAHAAGRPIDWPDAVFDAALKFFGAFSWNLNDVPGGEDNEINPDVLGYILEKYVNQKAFGAYYTRPEITGYLCERTIHRLILDAINTPKTLLPVGGTHASPSAGPEKTPATPASPLQRAGVPVRQFDSVPQLIKKLDDKLATRLLDDVLPSLSLLDPACGSGAFLVAAMKTLIDVYQGVLGWIPFHGNAALKARLATVHKDHASLDYFIKHRIITDNLYGVDLMPEAVEIARLRLFLSLAASVEHVDQLEPLPNIDFNVMDGNSLIGLLDVKPGAFDQGKLFGQTYDQIVADRDRRLETYRHTAAYAQDLTGQRDAITAINDKAQQQLNDILLDQFDDLKIKFEQATWDDAKGKAGKPIKRPLTPDDIGQLRPFHWAFAFSKVMKGGGFDAIITNPPWESFKPNGKEFFQLYSSTVAKTSMALRDFEAEQEILLKDEDTRTAWLAYLSSYPHQSDYFRAIPEFEHQTALVKGKKTGSDLNLYKLFIERCFRLIRDNGQCGIVIPAGIYNDLGAKGLREMLFNDGNIGDLRSFANERFIFDSVDHRFKFCLLTFGRGRPTRSFFASFNISLESAITPESMGDFLVDRNSMLEIHVPLVERLSPDSLSVMEFKSHGDVAIVERIFRFPSLGTDVGKKWKLRLTNDLHMTGDSDLFQVSPSSNSGALYEGKMIHQFVSDHAQPRYWLDLFEASKRTSRDLTSAINRPFRLVHRSVARTTDTRTMISAVIPPRMLCGNSLNVDIGLQAGSETLYVCAILNSFVFDFALRQSVSANVNMFYIYQMPVPRVSTGDAAFAPIVERSAKLICTTPAFDDLAKEAGLTPPDHTAGVADPAGRATLRAELDAMVAHLYGLTADQFAHVLETFPLVDPAVRAAALREFVRMTDTGAAATFNPDLPRPQQTAGPRVAPADRAVLDLIAAGESKTVEFKSTARFNVKAGQPDPKMERIIAKTVAAFLNTDGGTLLIGVADDGSTHGLAGDFAVGKKPDRDAFELWLMQMLMNDFEKDVAAQLTVSFHAIGPPDTADLRPGARDVCRVIATPSPRPRYVKEDNQEKFYIRTGNASNALTMKELLPYFNHRWPTTFGTAATP